MASPKCQFVLNEIIYRGWRNWRDYGIVRKTIWFFLHFLLVAITCLVYIPARLIRRSYCCRKFKDNCCWKFGRLYELPYSKFVNYTTSYVLFLSLLFASSYQHEIGTTKTGLVWIGKFFLDFRATLEPCHYLKVNRPRPFRCLLLLLSSLPQNENILEYSLRRRILVYSGW